jgi:purine-binding chemotaxis protein CheW
MTANGDLHVVFRVAEAEYCVPASDVLHLESYGGATRVPSTAKYVAGLVQIRGRVVPVVDLRLRFGLPSAPPTIDTRVVVVQSGPRTVGLLVDSSREVVRIEGEGFKAPPQLVAEQTGGFIKSVAHTGQRMLLLIDVPKVIGEERAHGSSE